MGETIWVMWVKTTPIIRPTGTWRQSADFLLYVGKRFLVDQCTVRAAGLTYTTLLALVPLLAISFAIFSAFPAFDNLQIKVQAYIFENFVPQVGETVLDHLEGFTKQTGKLTSVGIIFLVATSIMLLLTISNAFDAIWRAHRERSLVARLLVYWAVLTLAPLLLGASVSLSGYLFTIAQASGVERLTGPLSSLTGFLPVLFQFGGFAVLYLIMPNSTVRIRDALVGGFTAALLFEILKKLFGYYVTAFPTYETIYGALATFPIFLIWMYISWLVVLLGAELTAAMPEWRNGQRMPVDDDKERPEMRLYAALAVLHALLIASQTGKGLSLRALTRLNGTGQSISDALLRALETASFVTRAQNGAWILSQDLEAVTLHDLSVRLGITPDITKLSIGNTSWHRRYTNIVERAAISSREAMSGDLKSILAPDENASIEDFEPPISSGERTSGRARILAWIGLGWLGSS